MSKRKRKDFPPQENARRWTLRDLAVRLSQEHAIWFNEQLTSGPVRVEGAALGVASALEDTSDPRDEYLRKQFENLENAIDELQTAINTYRRPADQRGAAQIVQVIADLQAMAVRLGVEDIRKNLQEIYSNRTRTVGAIAAALQEYKSLLEKLKGALGNPKNYQEIRFDLAKKLRKLAESGKLSNLGRQFGKDTTTLIILANDLLDAVEAGTKQS